MRQFPGHGVPRNALAATPAAPVARLDNSAGEHRTIRFEPLAGDLQAEVVQAGEGSQVGAREGSVGHVEVFPVGGVGTPIFGRPRRLPRDRRASALYTVICEEPVSLLDASGDEMEEIPERTGEGLRFSMTFDGFWRVVRLQVNEHPRYVPDAK